jgi:hypothetical protein
MKTAATVVQMLVRFTGLSLIVLGVLFWLSYARNLIAIHMLLGLVLVLALWTLAGMAARAGVHPGIVVLAVLWGFVVPVLGIMQNQLLVGASHWVIQVLHLLVGVSAMWQGEALAARIKQARMPVREP